MAFFSLDLQSSEAALRVEDHFARIHPEPRRVRQSVHEYFTVVEPKVGGRIRSQSADLNPFVNYTHLGTDFGFIGEVEKGLSWEVGKALVDFQENQWGGIWHSLAGLAEEKEKSLNFQACFPEFIATRYQPKIVGVSMKLQGQGRFKLELKDANDVLLWSKSVPIDSSDLQEYLLDVKGLSLPQAKFLNWIAEPGTKGAVDSLALIIEMPAVDYDESVFISSFAKLSRSYDESTGLVKDRAHILGGEFDNIPSSGLYALACAVGAHHGMVELGYARQVIRGILSRVSEIRAVRGILPHFVRLNDQKRYELVPGTEYSTVDSSIYYHAMILACDILGDDDAKEKLSAQLAQLNLQPFMDEEGLVSHGLRPDGLTMLPSVWRDWGGESALVVAMGTFGPQAVKANMAKDGKVHEGIGFISELQSLFYPQFDLSEKDQLTKQNWKSIRLKLLEEQKGYFLKNWPESRASVLGFYGLSAGEARLGQGYMVSGVELPLQSYLHPHYVLLSGVLEEDTANVYQTLRRMEEVQLFPPWGLVENFQRDLEDYLAMQGSLNAGFETIGAYHLLVKNRRQRDVIYETARMNPYLQKAIQCFYPREGNSRAESASRETNP